MSRAFVRGKKKGCCNWLLIGEIKTDSVATYPNRERGKGTKASLKENNIQ